MEAQRRSSGIRKPLADLTNNLESSQSSSSLSLLRNKPRNPILSSAISNFLPNSDAKSTPQIARAAVSRPLSQSGKGLLEELEPCSVYSRRPSAKKINFKSDPTAVALSSALSAEKRKSKGKEIAAALICPPQTKLRKIGEKVKEDIRKNLLNVCTAIRKKQKHGHKPLTEDSENVLSREYIEQQRAYFAEIDAFELSEEVVAGIHELD